VASTTIEVNPFLVDLIEAKLSTYDPDALAANLGIVQETAPKLGGDAHEVFRHVPSTFIEPGIKGRWLFDKEVATALGQLLTAINLLRDPSHARLFRVLVGGLLCEVSNVTISGKGRRYRRNWQQKPHTPGAVFHLFSAKARAAIVDIHRFSRLSVPAVVIHDDARRFSELEPHDIAVLSPPYPNSFDYTDVYNVELWMLGYLQSSADNLALRSATLTSHMQVHRGHPSAPEGSQLLEDTLGRLVELAPGLWSSRIPEMVAGYFADLTSVLARLESCLRTGALCCVVVGDSRYGGAAVRTAEILRELAEARAWEVHSETLLRPLRSSAQQGGYLDLAETLLVLRRT
jgi:hypothetical protein